MLHRNSELGGEKDYFAYLNQGISVDYAIVSPSHMPTFAKAALLMDMPFLFRDIDHWNKVMEADALKPIADDVAMKFSHFASRCSQQPQDWPSATQPRHRHPGFPHPQPFSRGEKGAGDRRKREAGDRRKREAGDRRKREAGDIPLPPGEGPRVRDAVQRRQSGMSW